MIASSPVLRRVYWETTAACNLRCIHCRRVDALDTVSPLQLTTPQAESMIDDLAEMGKPVLILSGGEPLYRADIFRIASYASSKGLPVALSTNGTLVTQKMADKIKHSGIYYASISLDGAQPQTHDRFRGAGNFDRAVEGFRRMKEAGLKVQINFTVTRGNVSELPQMLDLAQSLGACALYLFLLVPVGCGVQIAEEQMLSPDEVEKWLNWAHDRSLERKLEIRPICAPQYYRIAAQRGGRPAGDKRLGCLAGINICFISHTGDIYPCGYLPVGAGSIKEHALSEIWAQSAVFSDLRDDNLLEGKCGVCSFRAVCGGCRARGYFDEGSLMADDSSCAYEPAL
ncbi:MAG: hypothetical protein A2901_09005 [Elusimicrobia bacterium RIFCSPLOWO2_01_FULL_54_10]|nr:MAG: hypothetical protein A2901_09005 [Elusimicrobia bacterium RIFCSPLOWO2_01_FULL_54_10]